MSSKYDCLNSYNIGKETFRFLELITVRINFNLTNYLNIFNKTCFKLQRAHLKSKYKEKD